MRFNCGSVLHSLQQSYYFSIHQDILLDFAKQYSSTMALIKVGFSGPFLDQQQRQFYCPQVQQQVIF
jgi:hypothetical protein